MLLAVIGGGFVTTSCATESAGLLLPAVASTSSSQSPAQGGGPPTSVPIMEYRSGALHPAMYTWRINGKIAQKLPGSDSTVDRNELEGASLEGQTASLQTPFAPGRVRVIYYAQRFDQNRTDQAAGVSADCGATSSMCQIEVDGALQRIRFSTSIAKSSTMVIQVDYPTFSEVDATAGIGAYSVSWVLDFVS